MKNNIVIRGSIAQRGAYRKIFQKFKNGLTGLCHATILQSHSYQS